MGNVVINDEVIDRVSVLAKLELSKEERERAKMDMERMLTFVDVLNEVDTDGVEPLMHSCFLGNVFREDEVLSSAGQEKILRNAPKQQDGMFVVPRTIEPHGGDKP